MQIHTRSLPLLSLAAALLYTTSSMSASPATPSALTRNLRLYPWYVFAFHSYFWLPIFFLYFLEHMPLAQAIQLSSIYYFAVVLLEIPSGYFSDRFGRRLTLLLAEGALVAAYTTFYFADTFTTFAIAQILLAFGIACNSGTDTALLYDTLASLDQTDQYPQREAVATRNNFLGTGIAAPLGGLLALIDLKYAYLASAIFSVGSLVLVLFMCEPTQHQRASAPPSLITQLKVCARALNNRFLAWLFLFYVVMTILNHIPYEFCQPYINAALDQIEYFANPDTDYTTFLLGVYTLAVMLIAAFFASKSIALERLLRLPGILLTATALQTLLIVLMAFILHPLVAVLLLMRSVPRALMTAPLNAAIAPRIDTAQRATYLSVQSLVGRLAFSAWLLILSLIPTVSDDGQWPDLALKLTFSAVLALAALFVLAISWHYVKRTPHAPSSGTPSG